MADELESIKIDELPQASYIDTNEDYVPIVQYSSDPETVKIHPNAFNSYDNSKSKLHATNYQDAIDELASMIELNEEE